ncbi:MAG: MsnO8 family LLM class oxidoreductase, partial [Candidatus Eremiobacteraeota bacterium]|nr:MsnO8 family LLM class oxidoreductase [Candidatus Eremiobacteraeota bacterium]
LNYLQPALPGQSVRAVPGAGAEISVWLLGSSLFSAQLAAALGLPFAFASHFAPDMLMAALRIYRDEFRPSSQLNEPYAMAGVSVIAAGTFEEARRLFTSQQQSFINLRRGRPGPLPPPVDSMDGYWSAMEQEMVDHSLMHTIVGTPDMVERGLAQFVERTGVDEVIATGHIYDHRARLNSFEILAEAISGRNPRSREPSRS